MSLSTEVIKILDDICKRFGIVIDWTSANVIPYLEQLVTKYINYEIATSVVWFISGIIFTANAIIVNKNVVLYAKWQAETTSITSLTKWI